MRKRLIPPYHENKFEIVPVFIFYGKSLSNDTFLSWGFSVPGEDFLDYSETMQWAKMNLSPTRWDRLQQEIKHIRILLENGFETYAETNIYEVHPNNKPKPRRIHVNKYVRFSKIKLNP